VSALVKLANPGGEEVEVEPHEQGLLFRRFGISTAPKSDAMVRSTLNVGTRSPRREKPFIFGSFLLVPLKKALKLSSEGKASSTSGEGWVPRQTEKSPFSTMK
jgi:hypothetical protein